MELLAPAGNFEKLKVALSYGADAIYFSGKSFGLRGAASNFSLKEIEKAVKFVKQKNKKLFVTLNTFPNEKEIDQVENYLKQLSDFHIDGLIIADAGVFCLAKEITDFPLHISTQASVTNISAVNFWKAQGAVRIILAREVSISEAFHIKQQCNIEIEMFVHGSMCMAYSGNCTISNYTTNRDANRGGCVNSCRWKYSLENFKGENLNSTLYIMNSKDLWAVDQIKLMYEAKIDSLKIEGRMKSHLYLANTVSVYRQIIDYCLSGDNLKANLINNWKNKLSAVPNRNFSKGFLNGKVGKESVLYDNIKSNVKSNYVGIVRRVLKDLILLQVKNSFNLGDELAILFFDGTKKKFEVKELKDLDHEIIQNAKPNSLVYLKFISGVSENNVLILNSNSKKYLLTKNISV